LRDAKLEVLLAGLESERAYVHQVANANPSEAEGIIHSAGMTVRAFTMRATGELLVTRGRVSGTARLVARSAGDRARYDWQFGRDDTSVYSVSVPRDCTVLRSAMSVPLSGGSVTTISAPHDPDGSGPVNMAASSVKFFLGYVSDSNDAGPFVSGGVMSAPLSGGTAVTLASGLLGVPVRMLVDDKNIYWTAEATYPDDLLPNAPMSMPLTGGTPAPIFPDAGEPIGDPTTLAIDGVSVYWATSTAILRLTPK
jgi:hypothetical protein